LVRSGADRTAAEAPVEDEEEAVMADRYWVGGGDALWSATAGTKWATTSGGAGGAAVPTASDDVYFDASAPACTISANAVCRKIDCTGGTGGSYTNTLTHNSGVTLSIGTSTAGAGNVAFRLSAGMTWTKLGGGISFVSTSGTQQTITFAGKNTIALTFSGAGGSWQFADNVTQDSAGLTITHTNGTLDLNGKTITFGAYSSTSGTRTLTFNNATWNNTAGNFNMSGGTPTLNAGGTAALNMQGNSTVLTLTSGSTVANVTFSGTGSHTVSNNLTTTNFTHTGPATITGVISLGGTLTANGTLTLTANSAINRILLQSTVGGTSRTVTAAAVSLSNVDFIDITGAGAASPFTGTSLGDGLGNSGITFPASRTLFGVAAGNFSSSAMWSLSSGGSTGQSAPLPQDDVVLDANSGAGTYTCNLGRPFRNLTTTGFTRTLNLPGTGIQIFGSITLNATMTYGNSQITFSGRGSHTITMAGNSTASAVYAAPGGTYTFQDDITTGNTTQTFNAGTIDINGKTWSIRGITSGGSVARTLTLNSGTISVSMNTGSWNIQGTNFTFNGNGTVAVGTGAGPNFTHGVGGTFTNLSFAGSANPLTISNAGGANVITVTNLSVTGARTLNMTAGQNVWAVTNFSGGSAGNLITFQSTVAGTQWGWRAPASAVFSTDYISLKDSLADISAGATFYAGANSTNVSNNTNWNFTAPPSGNPIKMMI
jgi:hypothetical protein